MTGDRMAAASLALALCAAALPDPAQAQRAGLEDGWFVAEASASIVEQEAGNPGQLATLTGPAVFYQTGRGFVMIFCGQGEAGPWEGRLWVRDAMGREARREARVQDRQQRAAARRQGRAVDETAPPATETSLVGTYPLSTNQVMAGLSGRRFSQRSAAVGTIEVASHDAELLTGSAKLSFPGVYVYGTPGTRTVDWEMAFRALPGSPRDCRSRAKEEAER